MKHLLVYRLFESVNYDDIKNDILDIENILIDLKDDDWVINVHHYQDYQINKILGCIKKNQNKSQSKYPPNSEFKLKDIKEYLDRILNVFKKSEIKFRICTHEKYFDDHTMNLYKTGVWKDIDLKNINYNENILGIDFQINMQN